MTIRDTCPPTKSQAGFAAIDLLVMIALVGALTVAISPGSNTKELREEFKKNVLAPMFSPAKPQEQAPAANSNPWIFPVDSARQPPQSPPPPEPVNSDRRLGLPISPNWALLGLKPETAQDSFVSPPPPPTPGGVKGNAGGVVDQCEGQWQSSDGGKTKTLVPKSCTKPYHGPNCSLAAAH